VTTDTPLYLATQLELGIDIEAIRERPRYEIPTLDVDVRWKVICNQFAARSQR
jgi:hypothetical protein